MIPTVNILCLRVLCEQGSQQSSSSGGGNSGAIPAIEITKENTDRNDMAYASDDSDYEESASDRRASNAAPPLNTSGVGGVDNDQVAGARYQQSQPQQQHHHHHHQQHQPHPSPHGAPTSSSMRHQTGGQGSSPASQFRPDHGQVQQSPGVASSAHHPQQQQVSDTKRCYLL